VLASSGIQYSARIYPVVQIKVAFDLAASTHGPPIPLSQLLAVPNCWARAPVALRGRKLVLSHRDRELLSRV